tara:strand:+ start:641 stop:2578 length:1938 start_codon:yes stop_codon:yes gene_type:complete
MATKKTLRRAKGYAGDLVGGINIPNIGFQQYSAQSDFYSTLDKKLDAITKFSTIQAGEEALTRADEFSVKNPINLNDFLNASKIEKQELVGDDNYTEYGKRVRLNQKNNILTQLTLTATRDFQNLRLEAEQSDMDPEEFANLIDARVNGYADLGFSIDSELGTKIKQSVGATANSMFVKYSDQKISEVKTQRLAQASQYAEFSIDEIGGIIASSTEYFGDLEELPDGTMGKTGRFELNPDQMLEAKKAQVIQTYIKYGKTPAEIKAFETSWDAEVLNQKNDYLMTEAVDTAATRGNPIVAFEIYNNFVEGKITNPKVLAIYNSLSSEEQNDFLDKVSTYSERITKLAEDEDKAEKSLALDNIDDAVNGYRLAEKNGDQGEAEKYINLLFSYGSVAADKYKLLSEDFDKDVEEGFYLVDADFDYLADSAEDGTLTNAIIRNFYDEGKILKEDKAKLVVLNNTKTKDSLTVGRRSIKLAVGYPTDVSGGFAMNAEFVVARDLYRKKDNAFTEWYLANQDASANEITEYAKTVISNTQAEVAVQIKSDNLRTKMLDGQSGLNTTNLQKYFGTDMVDEGWLGSVPAHLETTDGIALLVTELGQLKGYKKSRPLFNGEPITDNQIELFIVDLNQYSAYLKNEALSKNKGN